MKKEKIFLSVTALFLGLLVAVVAFYFYESSKKVPQSQIQKLNSIIVSPTPVSSIFLTLDAPDDESVVDSRLLTVSGKTIPGAKIVVLTQTNEQGAQASTDGSFSTQITLDQDENIVEVDAVGPNGEVAKVRRTVTFSTENF